MTSAQEPLIEADEELDGADIGKQLESVKWYLWHGYVVGALDTIEDIEDELDLLPKNSESRKKLLKAQGLQANQQVTFLSDGAHDVRELHFQLLMRHPGEAEVVQEVTKL